MKTAEQKAYLARRRTAHHKALATLHAHPDKADGLKMWRALRKIETRAHDAATAQCNGAAYNGQPFRNEDAWDSFRSMISDAVCRVFGILPDGFFINGDARGAALKIDSERATIPQGMETDWGQDGILAADIND